MKLNSKQLKNFILKEVNILLEQDDELFGGDEEEGDEDVAETIQLNGHTYRLAEEEDEEGEEIAEEEEGENPFARKVCSL